MSKTSSPQKTLYDNTTSSICGELRASKEQAGIPLTDKISTLEVEAIELIASLFRVGHIFIHNESSAFGVPGYPLANLAIHRNMLASL